MTKFHLTAAGDPGECKAFTAPCPLGGEDAHAEFSSIKEARSWAESKTAAENGGSFQLTESSTLGAPVADVFRASEHKEVKGKWYTYASIKLKNDEIVNVPLAVKTQKLVNDPKIWDFIDSIPQELFQDKKLLAEIESRVKF